MIPCVTFEGFPIGGAQCAGCKACDPVGALGGDSIIFNNGPHLFLLRAEGTTRRGLKYKQFMCISSGPSAISEAA